MTGAQSTTSQALDFILAFIIISALAIGLLSMLSRKLESWWIAFCLWYDDTQAEIMSRRAMREAMQNAGTGMVSPDIYQEKQTSIPPSHTGIEPVPETAIPPQENIMISAHMSRRDRIVLLSTWKNDDGTYSISANAIAEIMKGNRNEVLALVRDVREPAPPSKPVPIFRPLTVDSKPVLNETDI